MAGDTLSPAKKLLLKVAAFFLAILLAVSGCGLVVLMDFEEKKLGITNTAFGELWLRINKGNPVLQPFLFNFALIGLVMIYKTFHPTPVPRPTPSAPPTTTKKTK